MSKSALNYRPDIDGLRAVAVLSVVVFHLDPHWIPGGFLGVDIFFVISGFLITRIIVSESADGRFSLGNFYLRRIKRIFPAMLTVVAATLLVGQMILLPADFLNLTESALATVLSAANIYFTYFSDTSYFASDASLLPLLHMWSLGVEEQFYIFWPVCAVFLFKEMEWRWLTSILVGLALGSFLLGQFIATDAPLFAYYMLPTRAGELLLGALAFNLVKGGVAERLPRQLCEVLSLVSLTVVLLSFYWVDENMPFPGLVAIPPTLAIATLMVVGTSYNTITARLLSLKPMVWVGLISYSLYLWHWPVLAFARYAHGTLSVPYLLLAFAVMIALSIASYRLVERPFRHNDMKLGDTVRSYFIYPSLAVGLVFVGSYMSGGLLLNGLGQYPERLEQIGARSPSSLLAEVCQRPQLTASDVRDPACASGSSPNVLLWGDSNAAHFVPALNTIGDRAGFTLRNAAHSSCPPLMNNAAVFVDAARRQQCARSSEVVHRELPGYQGVILAANWPAYWRRNDTFLEELRATVEALLSEGKTVYLVGRIPRFDSVDAECERKALRLFFIDCRSRDSSARSETEAINEPIQAIAEATGAEYIDFTSFLCQATDCFPYISNANVYYDPVHLSGAGSALLGQEASDDLQFLTRWNALAELPVRDTTSIVSVFDQYASSIDFDLTDRSAWRGYQAELAVAGEGFSLGDGSASRFSRAEARGETGRGYRIDAGQSAVVEVTFEMAEAVNPLVRLRSSLADQEEGPENRNDLSFIVFPEEEYVDIRPQGAEADYELTRLGDGIYRFKGWFPPAQEHRFIKLILYPAAATTERDLDASLEGTLMLREVHLSVGTQRVTSPQ